jgi:hypothetical protein
LESQHKSLQRRIRVGAGELSHLVGDRRREHARTSHKHLELEGLLLQQPKPLEQLQEGPGARGNGCRAEAAQRPPERR